MRAGYIRTKTKRATGGKWSRENCGQRQKKTGDNLLSKDYRPLGQGVLREKAQLVVVLRGVHRNMRDWVPTITDDCRREPVFIGQQRESIPCRSGSGNVITLARATTPRSTEGLWSAAVRQVFQGKGLK